MPRLRTLLLASLALGALGACAREPAQSDRDSAEEDRLAGAVETSGKSAIEVSALPPEVVVAISAARPDFVIESAEIETRNGRVYYDVEGRLADGTEIEFDLTEIDGVWTIVEMQRDIGMDETPEPVRAALAAARSDFAPTRIIESDQLDGVVIYEFFMPRADGSLEKAEVKYEAGVATFLEEEWAH